MPLDGFDNPTAVEILATPLALINGATGARIVSKLEGTLRWPVPLRQNLDVRDKVARGELEFRGDGRTKVEVLLTIKVADGRGEPQTAGYIAETVDFYRGAGHRELRIRKR